MGYEQEVYEDAIAPPKPTEPAKPLTKQIFVAYSYKDYPKADYRKVYTELEASYQVTFIFADEQITNKHIMQKIASYIRSSDFSIFDISGWNPNVALELGFAMAADVEWYIAVNPDKTQGKEVPSDLGGIDRVQYGSFDELGKKLATILEKVYPKRQASTEEFLEGQTARALDVIRRQPGLSMTQIADELGVDLRFAQLLVKRLMPKKVTSRGATKATRYFPVGPDGQPVRETREVSEFF